MNTIQKKLLAYMFFVSIVPIAILGLLYYESSVNNTKDKIYEISTEILEQMNNEVYSKTNRVQNAIDLLFTNERIHSLLRSTDFSTRDANARSAMNEFNIMFSSFFDAEESLEDIILFSTVGGVYSYSGNFLDENIANFSMKYGKPDAVTKEITWLGSSMQTGTESSAHSVFMASFVIRDTSWKKDDSFLATAYIVLKNNLFEHNRKSDEENTSIMIYDKNAKVVFARGGLVFENIWRESLKSGVQIFRGDKGNFHINIDGEDYIVVFFTSPTTKWKYVRIVPYEDYFNDSNRIGFITVLSIFSVLLIEIFINYFFVKKFTSPIHEMVSAMNEVGNQNFEVSVSANSNDEFGMIGRGFNSMVAKIKEQFDRVVLEERKRKDADILALQYQVNPHFLYNTLSAIRLTAVAKGEKEIAEMLLILARFLRKTLKNANAMTMVSDEIRNIKDYVALYQIRYDNQIAASYEVEETTENCRIPSMLLQPIIENAIMHGLNKKFGSGERAELIVRVEDLGDDIRLVVRDNGIGLSKEKIADLFNDVSKSEGLHIGIINIHKRVCLLFGEEYGISVISEEGKFAEIRVTLPKIEEHDCLTEDAAKQK